MNPMLLVALDCQFVIAPSVSSYVYLYVYDIMMMFALYTTNTLSLLSIILSEWNNRPLVDMSLHLDT